MEELIASSLTRQRFYALMLGIFAVVAAALGAIGTYGVLAYAVSRRTNEIGVRMALGAKHGDVLRMVLRRGLILAVIGIVVGVGGAAALSSSLTAMLYGLTPLDPTTYLSVIGLFAAVVVLASYMPARRAAKVDPLVAIRCE
jgi:putative ABC transport system permease protein